jgi:cell wall-associated NlpC family hydrolase
MKKIILTLCFTALFGFSPGIGSYFVLDPLMEKVETFIEEWWNVPYVYGGTTKRGIDCSAFTQRFYREIFNKKIPRTARSQYRAMKPVEKDSIQTGDLVFFSSKLSPSGWHVGVYLQNDSFVHAANRKEDIKISNLSEPSYQKSYKGARRL